MIVAEPKRAPRPQVSDSTAGHAHGLGPLRGNDAAPDGVSGIRRAGIVGEQCRAHPAADAVGDHDQVGRLRHGAVRGAQGDRGRAGPWGDLLGAVVRSQHVRVQPRHEESVQLSPVQGVERGAVAALDLLGGDVPDAAP
ncbi:hypothetical protein GCM10029978_020880 [Actinoallomurus acanthiterrae]